VTAAIVVLAVTLLVPGAGAALAFAAPRSISIETRIALTFGLGYAVVAATAMFLALVHLLTLPALVVGLVCVTAVAWTLALRRAPMRAHSSALVDQAKEAPFALAAGLALLLAVAATRLVYPAEASLRVRAPWRYWSDGLEVAAAGHVPDTSRQWGAEIPTTVSKVVFNAFQGGMSLLLGQEPLPAMQAILVLTSVGLAAALLALGRDLGLGVFAPLVPVLTLFVPDELPLTSIIGNDLRLYSAENVGRMVAVCGLVTGIYALRADRRRAASCVTGGLFALGGLTHLIPALVAGAMLALYACGEVLLDRGLLRRATAVGAASAIVFGATYVGVIASSGGELGWDRATQGAGFDGLPPDVDPTRSFQAGRFVVAHSERNAFFIPPRDLVERFLDHVVASPASPWVAVVFLLALAAATVILVRASQSFFPHAVMAWGLAPIFLAVALFFSARYDTAVPGGWGVRRLFDYAGLLPALLVPACLQGLAGPLERRSRWITPVLALCVAVLAVTAVVARVPADRELGRADDGLAVAAQVARQVPCGARMLANVQTAGFWEATTGRRALTEGMAPYLRPEVMARALPLLVEANEFFDDPEAGREFLEREDVDYVVVVSPRVWAGYGGGNPPTAVESDAVAAAGLRPVFRDRRVSIFAVGEEGPSPRGPKPGGRCAS
jgi:hypothetical protein